MTLVRHVTNVREIKDLTFEGSVDRLSWFSSRKFGPQSHLRRCSLPFASSVLTRAASVVTGGRNARRVLFTRAASGR